MAMRNKLVSGLCALGACALLGSLFVPWYGPVKEADYLTIFGSSEAVDFLTGRLNPDGWQALSVIDIYLAALSGTTLLLCTLGLRRNVRAAFAVMASAALVAVGLIVYRLVDPAVPFDVRLGIPGEPVTIDSFVDPRFGIYVALASAICILVGSTALAYGTGWLDQSVLRRERPGTEDPRLAH